VGCVDDLDKRELLTEAIALTFVRLKIDRWREDEGLVLLRARARAANIVPSKALRQD
jgi:hypothetical protein